MKKRFCRSTGYFFASLIFFLIQVFHGCGPKPARPPKVAAPQETAIPETPEKKPEPRFMSHHVMEGEDPGKIVDIYYGTSFSIVRFDYLDKEGRVVDLVLEFNGRNPDDLTSGEIFRIPEIPGLPFKYGHISQRSHDLFANEEYARAIEMYGEIRKFDKSCGECPVMAAKCKKARTVLKNGVRAFETKQYRTAANEFEKVLAANPDGKKAREFLYKSRMILAADLWLKGDPGAEKELKAASELKKGCEPCLEFERRLMEDHYAAGFEHYENGAPDEALKEWDLVRFIDPNYNAGAVCKKKTATGGEMFDLFKTRFDLALELFKEQNYQDAITEIEACRKYEETCQMCADHEKTVKRDLYEAAEKDMRMRMFREAVGKWRLIQFIDPAFREMEILEKINIAEKLL